MKKNKEGSISQPKLSKSDKNKALQRKLKAAGYDPKGIDGIIGKRTRAAIRAYQMSKKHLWNDGIAGENTMNSLNGKPAKQSPKTRDTDKSEWTVGPKGKRRKKKDSTSVQSNDSRNKDGNYLYFAGEQWSKLNKKQRANWDKHAPDLAKILALSDPDKDIKRIDNSRKRSATQLRNQDRVDAREEKNKRKYKMKSRRRTSKQWAASDKRKTAALKRDKEYNKVEDTPTAFEKYGKENYAKTLQDKKNMDAFMKILKESPDNSIAQSYNTGGILPGMEALGQVAQSDEMRLERMKQESMIDVPALYPEERDARRAANRKRSIQLINERLSGQQSGGNYNTGGDLQLSNDSMQVKYQGDQTDGKSYGNVNLDKNEVVAKDKVFSDDLFDPTTGKKFSELAKRLQKAKGKAEKKSSYTPRDKEALNTMKRMEEQSSTLFEKQEAIATALGLRNRPQDQQHQMPDGSMMPGAQHGMATGGRLNYSDGGQHPWLDKDNYDPYAAFEGVRTDQNVPNSPGLTGTGTPTGSAIGGMPGAFNAIGNITSEAADTPTGALTGGVGGAMTNASRLISQSMGEIKDQPKDSFLDQLKGVIGKANPGIGAGLQIASLAQQGIQAYKPTQQETLRQDRSAITREQINANPLLQNSTNQFQSALNRNNRGSYNANRSIANNLFSNKLSADNKTLFDVTNKNKQLNQQYEGRNTAQGRYNIKQADMYDDLNSRNLGQSQQMKAVFGQSANNLGQAKISQDMNEQAARMLQAGVDPEVLRLFLKQTQAT